MTIWLTKVLFVFSLAVGVPFLSFLTMRRHEIRLLPRLHVYLSASISQWLLAGLGAGVVLLTGPRLLSRAFRFPPAALFFRWTGMLAAISLAAMVLLLVIEGHGWWPEESDLVLVLIPESSREKLWAVLLVAPTAAICEEFLYRGYLLSQLVDWWGNVNWAWAASSAAFGLAHVYQGLNGMARAALLGALLALPVVRLGSLYPSIAAHFLIDAVALAWLGPAFLKRTPAN